MDGKGELNEKKQFELTCSSLGTERIDSNNSVDSTVVSKDPPKLNDENEKESSLGTGKVVDSAKSSEITIQKQGERESSTSSYHEGESTSEKLSMVLRDLDGMSLTDLMSLCKTYRDRVVAGDSRGDVRILQEINRVLSIRINRPRNSGSFSSRKEYPSLPEPNMEGNVSEGQDSFQSSINLSIISNDSLDLSALQENEDELGLLKSLRKASEDSNGTVLQFSSGESPLLTELKEMELIPLEEDYIVERTDGKHFESHNLHSLELKQVRIRRKSAAPESNSKRVHLSV